MNARLQQLINDLELNIGGDIDAIEAMTTKLEIILPEDYKDFFTTFNGGEGMLGSSYIVLWSVDDIPALNDGYEVKKFAPSLLYFGSDGGGTAYAFDRRTNNIVEVPFIGMDEKDIKIIGNTLEDLLEYVFARFA